MYIENTFSSNHHNLNANFHQQLTLPNIDQQNLSLLISKDYLRNYTYLEYCMFPELFQLYVVELQKKELQNLLDSYLGTISEFFVQASTYEMSYHGKLWDEEFLDRLVQRVDERNPQSLEMDVDDITNIDDIIFVELTEKKEQIDQLRNNMRRGTFDMKLLLEIVDTLDFLSPKQQMPCVLRQIRQQTFASPLFNLLCMIIKQLIYRNYTFPLSKYPRYKYLIHAAIWNISTEYQTKIKKGNPEMRQVIELLQVRLVPMEIELNDFLKGVGRGEVKEGSLTDMVDSRVYGAESYRLMLELVKSVDLFVREYRSYIQQVPKNESSSLKTLNQIIDIILKIIPPISFDEQSILKESTKQKNAEPAKQLSNQNLEKIARLLLRLNLNSDNEGKEEMMEIEKMDNFIGESNKIDHNRQKLVLEENVRELLDEQFLLYHSQLYEILCSEQHNKPIEDESFTQTIIKTISKMFSTINQSLSSIFSCLPKSVELTVQKITSINYECSLLIEAINFFEEKLRQLTVEFQMKDKQKTFKIRNSLFANILTLKVLHSVFSPAQKSRQELEPNHDQEIMIKSIDDIKQLFNDVLKYSIDSSTSFNSFLSQSFSSNSSQKQQLNTLPALECILFLFSSIQLWYELSGQSCVRSNKGQIEQFMESVIKRYSQQNIKIGADEIIYVERILISLQVFQEIGREAEDGKVNEFLTKLIELKKHKGLNIISIINSRQSLEKILKILSYKLLAACLLIIQQNQLKGQDNNGFNQNLLKLPFWNCILINNINDLTGQRFVEMIEDKIFSKEKDLFMAGEDFIKQKNMVDLDYHTTNKPINFKTIITSGSAEQTSQLFSVFCEMNEKYLRMIEFKRQLNEEATTKESLKMTFEQQKYQSMEFYLQLVSFMYQSMSCLKQSTTQQDSLISTGRNHLISQAITKRFQYFINSLKEKTSKLVELIFSNVIEPKLQLFKPSIQQVNCLLNQVKIENTEENREKMNEKITELHKLYNQVIGLGLFGLSYVAWVKMEIMTKIQMLYGDYRRDTQQSSTFYLLQTITLLSLTSNTTLQVDFQALESHLQSNIQPNPKITSQSAMSRHQLPLLPITSKNIKNHIQFLDSFQFIEFIYEYLPFDISSEEKEMQLFNFSTDYVLKDENHQYLNQQKEEKVRFNKICKYLRTFIK